MRSGSKPFNKRFLVEHLELLRDYFQARYDFSFASEPDESGGFGTISRIRSRTLPLD
jgi:hypothetical protein